MNNFEKLKRIYKLILQYEGEYGSRISLETLEVSNNIREINTIDDLLENLEDNKPD